MVTFMTKLAHFSGPWGGLGFDWEEIKDYYINFLEMLK